MAGALLSMFYLLVGGIALILGGRRLNRGALVMFGAGQVFGSLLFGAIFAAVALLTGAR